jgi:hypothetical protein
MLEHLINRHFSPQSLAVRSELVDSGNHGIVVGFGIN